MKVEFEYAGYTGKDSSVFGSPEIVRKAYNCMHNVKKYLIDSFCCKFSLKFSLCYILGEHYCQADGKPADQL